MSGEVREGRGGGVELRAIRRHWGLGRLAVVWYGGWLSLDVPEGLFEETFVSGLSDDLDGGSATDRTVCAHDGGRYRTETVGDGEHRGRSFSPWWCLSCAEPLGASWTEVADATPAVTETSQGGGG